MCTRWKEGNNLLLRSGLLPDICGAEDESAWIQMNRHLWNRYRLIVTPIKHKEFEGLRVAPSVYTTLSEIDRFIDAMENVIEKGIEES